MIRFITALILVLLPALAHATEPSERWYVLDLQGQRAGWMRETVKSDGDNVVSDTEMKIEVKRGSVTVAVTMSSEWVETADGKPVSMSTSMKLGKLPTVKKFRFLADGVEVEEGTGQAKKTSKQPLPEGEWLTPRGADRAMQAQLKAGAMEISIRTIDPTLGLKIVTATNKLVERTNLDVVGRTVPAIKWSVSLDAMPGMMSTIWTDEVGHAIRTETDLGIAKVVVLLADKAIALAKLDPPELLESTLIHPDKAIADARTLRKGTYIVEAKQGKLPDIPALAAQKFERIGENSARITVDLDARAAAPAPDAADKQFTECSTMVTCGDEKVKTLLDKALGEDSPTAKSARAEALRRYVHRFIKKKGLDVGFASAAEVARTAAGDCSEHGVLLCALLRADGIPARVVSGLVYVDGFSGHDNIFGYHMWTQALLDDGTGPRWIDLDAAIDPNRPFDATHIALSATSLNDDGMINSLVELAPLLGTLKIKVEEPK